MRAQHPIEFWEDRPARSKLTVIQKCITYVITSNGGSASEDNLLGFLKTHWQLINSNLSRPFFEEPSTRLLHINFSLKKGGLPLFIQDPERKHYWKCNSVFTQNSDSPNTHLFEIHIQEALKMHGQLDIDELYAIMQNKGDANGMFRHLDVRKRIRACLIVHKNMNIVQCDPVSEKWFLVSKSTMIARPKSEDGGLNYSSSLSLYQSVQNYSVDQVWAILKQDRSSE